MLYLEIFSALLIGSSFSFLIYNKIAYGFSLSLGIIFLLLSNWELFKTNFVLFLNKKEKPFLLIFFLLITSFSISSILSIRIERSFPVLIYFILFIFFSLTIYLVLIEKKKILNLILRLISLSLFLISLLILIYNLNNYSVFELIKFKGYMNIITLLTFINFFLFKSKLNLLTLSFLFPNIFMTGSSSSILGIVIGFILCFIFYIIKKFDFNKFNTFLSSLICVSIIISSGYLFIENLPKKFDPNSVENFKHKIPTNMIDVHRQFIWGFSVSKIKEKPFFGYGPDSSNFIEGSQRIIGLQRTGNMNFIPSHPHNFLIELLLETGIFGTLLFLFLILIINLKVWNLSQSLRFKFFLIFFNSYFWGSSLVNFSFWLGWWQSSYFLLLCLLASKEHFNKKQVPKLNK